MHWFQKQSKKLLLNQNKVENVVIEDPKKLRLMNGVSLSIKIGEMSFEN